MGLLRSIFIETLAGATVAGAEGIAQYRAEHAPQPRGRKSSEEGCTPCAAMAMVEEARQAAGFGGPPPPPPRKKRRKKPAVAGAAATKGPPPKPRKRRVAKGAKRA